MLLATALVYPCLLVVLCAGAGLLVDRVSGRFLPGPLLLPVGAAALIALSQLSTYGHSLAPATPYALALVAAAGFLLERGRVGELRDPRSAPALQALLLILIAYLAGMAPVLAAGRSSFSSFMALSDSAVHMMGADYLIRHGQDYAHLDLANSYGRFVSAYYGAGYPSGADTFFGASAKLLGLPLIWAFQPFNAFGLAIATGPAWLIARRMGLPGGWAGLAALSAVLGALVYGYELVGSVKEMLALAMILPLGALASLPERWLEGPATRAIPFALLVAAGLGALGVAFGVWALAAALVPAVVLAARLHGGTPRRGWRGVLGVVAIGGAVMGLCALPTWTRLSSSLRVAQNIASTSNAGNLLRPLRAIQLFGVWLRGSYKQAPAGTALTLTHVLALVVLALAALGAVWLLRRRSFALAGWLAAVLLAFLLVRESVTAWGAAKALVLSSPAVVLLAWGGVAALRSLGRTGTVGAGLLALAILAGVAASDALQYHSANLAPTARYEELAKIDERFAGHGPALFTDFDEYALYELRDLDVGGPDFVYPPPALAGVARGYGWPVELDAVLPRALAHYPLIVTRRDPLASRPPAAYRLVWEGARYQVWRRVEGARPALAHLALSGSPASQCRRIGQLASRAPQGTLTAARAPELVQVSLRSASRPRGWGRQRAGLAMKLPGTLVARVVLPAGGDWEVWLRGQFMPRVRLALDGRMLARIGGELSGNSLVPDVVGPVGVRLAPGTHTLSVTREGSTLAPGDGGWAVLDGIALSRAGDATDGLRAVPVSAWRGLCGRRYRWVEMTR